jgi:hypothetical protein
MKAYTEVMRISNQKKLKSRLEKKRRVPKRRMDMQGFNKAMRKKGIDPRKVVDRNNLKKKGLALSKR